MKEKLKFTEEEALSEAEKLKRTVESGEAKDYQEAHNQLEDKEKEFYITSARRVLREGEVDLIPAEKISGEWSPDFGKMSWVEVEAKMKDLNSRNSEVHYRLPRANELLKAYKDKIEGFSEDLYWTSDKGIDWENAKPVANPETWALTVGLIPPSYDPTVSSEYSTVINMKEGSIRNFRRGAQTYYIGEEDIPKGKHYDKANLRLLAEEDPKNEQK